MRVGCVICGDLFIPTEDISATPCGHTFHSVCIIQWIERSKSCPQCRHKATGKSLVKLFFDTGGSDPSQLDPDTLQHQIDNLKFQIRLKEQEMINLKENNATLTKQNKAQREECKTVTSQLHAKDTTIMALKSQLQFMDRLTKEAQKAKDESKSLQLQLKTLQNVESIVSGTTEAVEEMLSSYDDPSSSTRSLATFCSILKKELSKAVEDKRKLRDEATSLRNKVKDARQNYNTTYTELNVLQQAHKNLQEDLQSLEKENNSLTKKVNALQEAISSPSGDVKNSALHRLLAESPAPKMLKRSVDSNSEDEIVIVTPEVVRKVSRSDESASTAECDDTSEESSEKVILKFKDKKLGERQPLAVTTNLSRPSITGSHNIFAKKKAALLSGGSSHLGRGGLSGGSQMGYDGLGGHHKVEIFPKPKPVTIKKKPVKIISKGGTNRIQTSTLKNYFQNTFDDI